MVICHPYKTRKKTARRGKKASRPKRLLVLGRLQALQAVFPEEGALDLADAEADTLRFARHVIENAQRGHTDAVAGPQDVGNLSGTVW